MRHPDWICQKSEHRSSSYGCKPPEACQAQRCFEEVAEEHTDLRTQEEVFATLPVWLPHEILQSLEQKTTSLKGLCDHSFLQSQEFEHLSKVANKLACSVDSLVGLSIWGDGVPFKGKSLLCLLCPKESWCRSEAIGLFTKQFLVCQDGKRREDAAGGVAWPQTRSMRCHPVPGGGKPIIGKTTGLLLLHWTEHLLC